MQELSILNRKRLFDLFGFKYRRARAVSLTTTDGSCELRDGNSEKESKGNDRNKNTVTEMKAVFDGLIRMSKE